MCIHVKCNHTHTHTKNNLLLEIIIIEESKRGRGNDAIQLFIYF